MQFKNKEAVLLNQGIIPKGMSPDLARKAQRKIKMLLAAVSLNDLRIPPSNRLEALQGDRKGQFSIRVNDRYRLCFVFTDGKAEQIEFIDYH